jgi:hypothetical protein
MSDGGEQNLQVATKPDQQVATKPNPEKMHEVAQVVALKLGPSSEGANQTPSVAVDQGAKPPSGAKGGSATITPSHNAMAQAILNEVGKGPILVVPSSVPMQPGNPAICLGNQEQINTYKEHVRSRASSYDPDVNIEGWLQGLSVNTILVSESVLNDSSEINKRAVIYHEFGHTFLDRTETAAVFAHELNCLCKKFSKAEVISWLKAVRGGGTYYVSYARDPGLKDLTDALASLDFDLATKKEKKVQDKQTSIRSRLEPGWKVSGSLNSFKKKVATDDELPPDLATMAIDTTFDWAGCTWQVYPRVYDYQVELVGTTRNLSLLPGKKLGGLPEQIKKTLGANTDMPPEVENLALQATFEWYDSTWKLVRRNVTHEIRVV